MNIDDCIIGEFSSDYFEKLEKWSEENEWKIIGNNYLLQSGEINFMQWFKIDKEIRSTMPPINKL